MGEAELLALGVGHDGPGVAELGVVVAPFGAEVDEAVDLLVPVVGDEVDVDAVLHRAGLSADTSPEAHEVQMQVYRSMSPARRVSIAVAMSEEMLAVTAAGIGSRHPDYDDEDVTWALRRLRLGDEIFRAVWPNAPLLTP